MRKLSTLAILAVTFFCGCVSQKNAQTQFLKVNDDYYARYCHAKSREAAISDLKDYLAAVDAIQKPWATNVLYSRGRSFTETRLSLIYEQLGDSKNARIFMDQALRDIEQDPQFDKSQPYDKEAQEGVLKRMAEKIDGLNSIAWQKTADHEVLSTH
jgi:hypothetical protein